MALTTLSVAVSVLVLKVHHMSPAYEVPGWVQRQVPCPRLGPATGTRCQAATGIRYQVGFSNKWYLVPGWVQRLVLGARRRPVLGTKLGLATGTWSQAGSGDWYEVPGWVQRLVLGTRLGPATGTRSYVGDHVQSGPPSTGHRL